MAIASDSSAPAAVSASGNTSATLTTASFTPPNNCLLVAIAGCGYNTNATSSTPTFSITDNVSGTWTKEASKFSPAGSSPDTLGGVFTKWVTTGAAQTVTLNTDTRQKGKLLKVLVLTGTLSSAWTGNTDAVDATALDHSFTTGTTGSWVVIAAGENATRTLTADGNTTEVGSTHDTTDACEMKAGRATSATGTPGATTLGWTGSNSGDVRVWVGVEILAASTNTNANAGVANATAAANAAVGATGGTPPAAPATATAYDGDVQSAVNPVPTSANATAAGKSATTTLASSPVADLSATAGLAWPPSPAVKANAGVAAVAVAALQPTITSTGHAQAPAQVASAVTAVARDATTTLASLPTAGVAATTTAANNAAGIPARTVNAGVATVTIAALSSSLSLHSQAFADVATAGAAGFGTTINVPPTVRRVTKVKASNRTALVLMESRVVLIPRNS